MILGLEPSLAAAIELDGMSEGIAGVLDSLDVIPDSFTGACSPASTSPGCQRTLGSMALVMTRSRWWLMMLSNDCTSSSPR